MVGVGHDFVVRQRGEVPEKSGVDKRREREFLQEGNRKMCQCVYREMGAHRGGGEGCFPIEWHNIGSETSTQSLMGVGYPGLEQSGNGSAKVGRGGVECRGRGKQPKASHSPFVREGNRDWWQTGFCSEDWHRSGLETVGDPSLHLPPMDLHINKKAFGCSEQVGPI